MIQQVNSNNIFTTQTALGTAANQAAQTTVADKINDKIKQDEFVKDATVKPDSGIYEKPKKITAQELKVINDQQSASFNKMISDMIGTQVNNVNKAMFSYINVSADEKAKAAASIADGGEYSVDAVSTRILDMAKALSGGDASKFDTLKNAVKKGFDEAEKQWGAKLPEISGKTYDKVMEGFDVWERELNA